MQLCLFQTAHVNMNTNVIAVTQGCTEVCIYSGLGQWNVGRVKCSRVCALPRNVYSSVGVTGEEVQDASYIKFLDLNKSIVTL